MAKILFVAKHGSDDQTLASMPFEMANVAVKSGHTAIVALLGEAAVLLKDAVIEQLRGLGSRPYKEVLKESIELGVEIFVCGICARTRGVVEQDLKGKSARFMSKDVFIELTLECDRVVSF